MINVHHEGKEKKEDQTLTQQGGVWPRPIPHLHHVIGGFHVEIQEMQLDVSSCGGVEGPQACRRSQQLGQTEIAQGSKPTKVPGVLTRRFVPVGLWVVWGVKGGIWLPEVKGSSTVSWTDRSREFYVNHFLHMNMFVVVAG